MNKARRILDSVKANVEPAVYDLILKSCGDAEGVSTPEKQADCIRDVLNELDKTCTPVTAERILKPCGHMCISGQVIDRAKELLGKAQDLQNFLGLLNENHIGGGGLYLKDGKIICVYNECYCDIPKLAEGLSTSYCFCSVGWCERLFSSVFGKEVEVRLIGTILGGADKCEFEISLD